VTTQVVTPRPPSRDWVRRYLALLGVEHPAPALDALARLTRAHLLRVPFENVSAILRRRAHGSAPVAPLDEEDVLAGWEARRAGGVCFEHAHLFGRLLDGLGYEVQPVAGDIAFPGSHQALAVRLAGARWLVDVGNGAPFFDPIPLDRPLELRRPGLGWRFGPDPSDPDAWIQERGVDAGWSRFCRYRLLPAPDAEREAAYQRHHLAGETWVTASLVLIRCTEDEVLTFRDGELTRFAADGRRVERLEDPAGWARLPDAFGLPALPLAEAARAWASITGRPPPPGVRAAGGAPT
jgi:arylamine N-acetyltransferase